MKNNLLPIVAGIGIGTAAYMSMKKGKGMGSLASQIAPFMSNMGGKQNSGTNNSNMNQMQ